MPGCTLKAMLPPRSAGYLFLGYARAYLFVSALLTGVVLYTVYRYGAAPLGSLIHFKLLTTLLLAGLTYRRNHRYRVFFLNCGAPPILLLSAAVATDLLACTLLTCLAYAAR